MEAGANESERAVRKLLCLSYLNTSMREEPERITTTITEPLIQYVRARAGKLHLKGFSHPMTLVLGLLLLTHDARCCGFFK